MSQLNAAINLEIVMPEIVLLVAAFILLIAIPLTRQRAIAPGLALVAVVVAAYFVCTSWNQQQTGYFDMVVSDNFSLFGKIIFLLTCGTAVLLSRDLEGLVARLSGQARRGPARILRHDVDFHHRDDVHGVVGQPDGDFHRAGDHVAAALCPGRVPAR